MYYDVTLNKNLNQKLIIMRKFFIVVLLVVSLIIPTVLIVKSIKFDQQCGGYLKQAADANTPELALERINVAISYIEKNHLTEGYTSLMWKTEDENIGFWYNNIVACRDELQSCLESSQLEKTNVLMKVRESLTDNGDSGVNLTIPDGISKYPNNWLWAILLTISMIILVLDELWIVYVIEYE